MRTKITALLLVASMGWMGCQCGKPSVRSVETELAADVESLDFGDVTVATKATQTVTLSNPGAAAIHLLSLRLEDGADPSLTFVAPEDTLPAGGSLAIPVTFAPTEEGAVASVLHVVTDATTHPTVDVALTGRGVASYVLTIQPSEIDFGDVLIHTQKTVHLTIKNDGSKAFRLDGVSLGTDDASSQFAFTLPAQTSIPPQGGVADVEVRYQPSKAATPMAPLTIDPTGAVALRVPLKGRCEPKIVVSPPAITFGTVDPTAKKLVALNLRNEGYAPLELSAALSAATDPDFALEENFTVLPHFDATLQPTPPGMAEQPNSTTSVLVTFKPATPSAVFGGEVVVTSDDPVNPVVVVPLGGQSGALPPCTISLTATVPGELTMTADDAFEVAMGGAVVGTSNNWYTAQSLPVTLNRHPAVKNVIAISAENLQNTGGWDRGVIASLDFDVDGGRRVVTDSSWKLLATTGGVPDGGSLADGGWADPALDDTTWPAPFLEGPHGMAPWGPILGDAGVGAEWLWSTTSNVPANQKVVDDTVIVRRTFYIGMDGTVLDHPGTCP